MALKEDLEDYVGKALREFWTTREGRKVPETNDLTMSNDAVRLDATVLYADLAHSTQMTRKFLDYVSAEIYKSYLYSASRIITACGGVITAYDGDRVMGVFIGDGKNSAAAKAGLQINWAVRDIIRPKLRAMYTSAKDFTLEQRVGIDTSKLFVARTGIRGSNDLVWVGNASNNAAKLAALDPTYYQTYITADVYEMLNKGSKYGGTASEDMWTDLGSSQMGYKIYGSSWKWKLD